MLEIKKTDHMPIVAYSSLEATLCCRGLRLGVQSRKRMELDKEVTDLVFQAPRCPNIWVKRNIQGFPQDNCKSMSSFP